MKVEFDQIIALIVIVAGMALRCLGIDTEMWALVLIAAGFVFGTGYAKRRKTKPPAPPADTTA